MLTLHSHERVTVVCSFCSAEHSLPRSTASTWSQAEEQVIAAARDASWKLLAWGTIACPRCAQRVP